MRLVVKGKNVEVTEALQLYGEKRLGKLAKLLDDDVTRVELELCEEHNPRVADRHVAEATIWTKGPTLRACERGDDMYACIDRVADKLTRQVTKLREKRQKFAHGGNHSGGNGKYKSVPAGAEFGFELDGADLPEGLLDGIAASANGNGNHGTTENDMSQSLSAASIVKTKQFQLGPMSPEDAALQLELIGHDFFVFVNNENNQTCVLYKRGDGHLGLIEPTLTAAEAI